MTSSLRAPFITAAIAVTALAPACDSGVEHMPDAAPTPPDAPLPPAQTLRVGVDYADGIKKVPTRMYGGCMGTDVTISPPPAVVCFEGIAACETSDAAALQQILHGANNLAVEVKTLRAWRTDGVMPDLILMGLPAASPQATVRWCAKEDGKIPGQFDIYVQKGRSTPSFWEPKLATAFLPYGLWNSDHYPEIRRHALLRAFASAHGARPTFAPNSEGTDPDPKKFEIGIMTQNIYAPYLSLGVEAQVARIANGFINSPIPLGFNEEDGVQNEYVVVQNGLRAALAEAPARRVQHQEWLVAKPLNP